MVISFSGVGCWAVIVVTTLFALSGCWASMFVTILDHVIHHGLCLFLKMTSLSRSPSAAVITPLDRSVQEGVLGFRHWYDAAFPQVPGSVTSLVMDRPLVKLGPFTANLVSK